VRKFFLLVGKEVRELATPQVIVPMVAVMIVFTLIGKILSKQGRPLGASQAILVQDRDNSPLSGRVVAGLGAARLEVFLMEAAIAAERPGNLAVLVIPAGFGERIGRGERAEVELVAVLRDLGPRALASVAQSMRAERSIKESVSLFLLERKASVKDVPFLREPVVLKEAVAIGGAFERVPIAQTLLFVQSQIYLFPVVIFMVILLSAQMVVLSVAAEKENKTLEILLSSPIGRRTLVVAKLSASALVALGFTAAYMVGMRSFMGAVSGQLAPAAAVSAPYVPLAKLGLALSLPGYALIAMSVMAGILCALSVAIVLGILADDVKSAHAATTPLMLLLMFSYLLPLLVDTRASPAALRALLWAIPFTHAFLAPQHVLLKEYGAVGLGILYQAGVFLAFAALASRLFSGESVLTLRWNLRFWKPRA